MVHQGRDVAHEPRMRRWISTKWLVLPICIPVDRYHDFHAERFARIQELSLLSSLKREEAKWHQLVVTKSGLAGQGRQNLGEVTAALDGARVKEPADAKKLLSADQQASA